MATRREEDEELDRAISSIRSEHAARAQERPRRGIVPISEQVRDVARKTGEAYAALKEELEGAVGRGRMIVEIAPGHILDSAWRDRDPRAREDEAFLGLCRSIESEGQISPVAVRRLEGEPGRYEVVFGHRRADACRRLDRPVRAIVLEGDERMLVTRMLIENAQRRDLSPIEKARHWRRLLAAALFDRKGLAQVLGVTPQQVSNVTSLADLPDAVLPLLGDPRGLAINVGRELVAVLAGRPLEQVLRWREAIEAGGGDANARARALVRLVRRGGEPLPAAGLVVRDRQGRRYGRLGRSGSQLVFRFQPGLDAEAVRRVVLRIPELYGEATGENAFSPVPGMTENAFPPTPGMEENAFSSRLPKRRRRPDG